MASNTREYNKEAARKFRERNPNYYRDYMRRRRANPETRARLISYNTAWSRERCKIDMSYRLACRLRSRLSRAVRGISIGSAVRDLGLSIELFKAWIEGQFEEGMTWDNYGEWELDHIRPLAAFDLTDREQFLVACNWQNYQPLWKADNRRKGRKQ